MRFSLTTVAPLCFIAWMSLVCATHGLASSCCLGLSKTRVRPENIEQYTLQAEGVCSIRAVVFHTKSGKKICSDPNDSWTRRTIEKLDQRKAAKIKADSVEEPTSTITPTESAMTERCNTYFESTAVQVSDMSEKTSPTSPGSDPGNTWTTAIGLKTDKEPQMLQMNGDKEEGPATTITPTPSPASKSKPKRKTKPPKRRLRKRSRSGRRWMKKSVPGIKATIQLSFVNGQR